MNSLKFNAGFLHPQFQVVERRLKEIEQQIRLLEIQELYMRRDYLEYEARYTKALLKLRELEVAKGTTETAEVRRKQRIKSLQQKLVTMPKPVEPDLSQLEAQREILEAKWMESMRINASLLVVEAIRAERMN
jgi:hypothetical protein